LKCFYKAVYRPVKGFLKAFERPLKGLRKAYKRSMKAKESRDPHWKGNIKFGLLVSLLS